MKVFRDSLGSSEKSEKSVSSNYISPAHPVSAVIEILVCPLCKGRLVFKKDLDELWCRADKLAFQICDGIPVMLLDQARKLALEELDKI